MKPPAPFKCGFCGQEYDNTAQAAWGCCHASIELLARAEDFVERLRHEARQFVRVARDLGIGR